MYWAGATWMAIVPGEGSRYLPTPHRGPLRSAPTAKLRLPAMSGSTSTSSRSVSYFVAAPHWTGIHKSYQDDASAALAGGPESQEAFKARAFLVASQPEMLRAAFRLCRRDGGPGSGLDGFRFEEFSNRSAFELCRELSTAIRSHTYRRGDFRPCPIPKGRDETRWINIPNLADRVVSKSVLMTLFPLCDPVLSPTCFSRRGRDAAVAFIYQETQRTQRHVWLLNDLSKAFDNVPPAPVLELLREDYPSDFVDLIAELIQTKERRGIPQGLSISSILLDLYLTRYLDRKWMKRSKQTALVRYVDDIQLQFDTVDEAKEADDFLRPVLKRAGFQMKYQADESIRDLKNLGRGESVSWLGYGFSLSFRRQLACTIREVAWERLSNALGDAHHKPNPPRSCRAVVLGWLTDLGPCYRFSEPNEVIEQINRTCAESGFDDLPRKRDLHAWWRRASDRFWKRTGLWPGGNAQVQ